ncbi:MAG: YbjQ family protein, partial [Candidatus Thiodiazotropha taylori]|nr:YbjQ family protein [Candidatus Thiodiazotropha taylori]
HYKSIIARENRLRHIPAVTSRFPPMNNNSRDAELVSGSVVISVDYFKRFIAALRNLVGGRVTSYESLVDRARREAILRMKAQAEQLNADIVFNVKLETSSIHKGRGNSIGSVEVLAYGTALKTQQ